MKTRMSETSDENSARSIDCELSSSHAASTRAATSADATRPRCASAGSSSAASRLPSPDASKAVKTRRSRANTANSESSIVPDMSVSNLPRGQNVRCAQAGVRLWGWLDGVAPAQYILGAAWG